MKMKLGEVLETYSYLKAIIDDNKLHLDTLCKFKLLGLLKSINTYAENFETIRKEKILEYGKLNEDNTTSIDENDTENLNKFNTAMNELINSDVDLEVKFLSPEDVIDKGIPSNYLIGIYNLIKEEN